MNFIHFGCWNNGICNEGVPNGLSRMMNILRTKNPDFITVAGDNYYPEGEKIEGKKIKKFNELNFMSGFECLSNVNLRIPSGKKYILYGNHDISDIIYNESTRIDEECKILLMQRTYNHPSFEFFNDVIELEKPEYKTLFIMIDTTIYDMDETLNIDRTCYRELDIGINAIKTGYRTIGDLIIYQQNKIIEILTKHSTNTFKNIIFVGHHPIISGRVKGGGNKFPELINLIQLFKNITGLLIEKNVVYLCADTHYYQESQITIGDLKITQYIVGTGGADLDEIPTEPFIGNESFNYIYNTRTQSQSYGFLEVNIDNEGVISAEFINTVIAEAKNKYLKYGSDKRITPSANIYQNKYLKYKTKYLELKKLIKK